MRARASLPLAVVSACCLLLAESGCCVKRGFVVRADCSLEVNRVPWMTGHGPKYDDCKTCSAKGGKDCDKVAHGDHGADGPPQEPLPGPPGHSRLHPVPVGPVFGPATEEPLPAPRGDESSPREATGAPSLEGPTDRALEEPHPTAEEPPMPDRKSEGSGVSRSTARRTSWTFVRTERAAPASKARPRTNVIP